MRVDVTEYPSADWTLQQLREVVGCEDSYCYLIHDLDSIFAKHLDESIKPLGGAANCVSSTSRKTAAKRKAATNSAVEPVF